MPGATGPPGAFWRGKSCKNWGKRFTAGTGHSPVKKKKEFTAEAQSTQRKGLMSKEI